MKFKYLTFCAIALMSFAVPRSSEAEVSTVRLAKQYGLAYLPLTVMQEEQLLEKQAAKSGLTVKNRMAALLCRLGYE